MDNWVTLSWQYDPPDFFGHPSSHVNGGRQFEIADGEVRVNVERATFERTADLLDEIQMEVSSLFQGAQVIHHRAFALHGPTVQRVAPDGTISRTRDVVISDTGTGSEDERITDSQGNVADTVRDREHSAEELARLAARHAPSDALAKAILQSYGRAVKDPANELAHLYDIRDALQRHFKGAKGAREALGLTNRNWKALGRLSNDEPLRQGRHRGKHPGQLRDATSVELEKGRAIAREMILAYLRYLDRPIRNAAG